MTFYTLRIETLSDLVSSGGDQKRRMYVCSQTKRHMVIIGTVDLLGA